VQYVGKGGGHLKPLARPYGPIDITRDNDAMLNVQAVRAHRHKKCSIARFKQKYILFSRVA